MKLKRVFIIPGLVALFLVAGVVFLRRVPQPPAFCDLCVMERDVDDWRFAGKWTLLETSSVRPTPVSELLRSHQAYPQHHHHWSKPNYLAESELETSDAPRFRSLGFLNAPRTLNFLRSVFDYTTPRDIASWREVAWQPAFASALEPALRFNRFPENGFATRDEFLAWWQQSAYPLFNRLNQVTVAD
ncbi:MAG: hypothetical protein JWN25_2506 [Verrucomicrobiales bacterium]|nr:hypothetical protein [Verrucomicrobiales bacterium]